MDLNKLTTGDKVLAGSGLALFIFSFLPWYGIKDVNASRNGWDFFFWGILPVLIALLLIAYVAVTKLSDGVTLPDLPVPYGLVVLGLAGLAALLVILKLLIGDSVDVPFGGSFDLDRKFGIFLAALAALGLAAGAFLKFQEDGGNTANHGNNAGPGTGTGAGPGGGASPTPF